MKGNFVQTVGAIIIIGLFTVVVIGLVWVLFTNYLPS